MINKNSFTLFEVLVSLVILAVVLSSVKKLFIDDNSIPVYYELQELENNFISTKTVFDTQNIKFKYH
jgi:prepilin-type N-terminal cleavage/methylation domain-containing protein